MKDKQEAVLVPIPVERTTPLLEKKARRVEDVELVTEYDRLTARADIMGLTGKEADLEARLEKLASEIGVENKHGWLSRLVAEKLRGRVG